MSDKIPPVKNAKYKEIIILGNPKTSPKTAANLTSPKPIPLPWVTKNIIRKNRNAPAPEKTKLESENGEVKIIKSKEIKLTG